MKKKLLMLSTTLSVLLLSGCGDTNKISKSVSHATNLSTLSVKVSTNQARYEGELDGTGGCDTSAYVVSQNPKNGTVTIYDNGYYTYIPNAGFQGKDSFSFKPDINSSDIEIIDINVGELDTRYAAVPSDLNITIPCAGSLEFTWSDNSDNEESFVIYQNDKPVSIVDGDSTTIKFEPKEGETYIFEVRAINSLGVSRSLSRSMKFVDGKLVEVKNTDTDIDENLAFNPKTVSTFNDRGYTVGVALSEDETIAYTVGSKELMTVDVSDISNPKLIGKLGVTTSPKGIAFIKDQKIAYIVDYSKGLILVDVSDPANPKYIKEFSEYKYAKDIELSEDQKTAYIANSAQGLKSIDISDPLNPRLMKKIRTYGRVEGVTLSKDSKTAYVAVAAGGFMIFDVSIRAREKKIGYLDTTGYVRKVVVSEDEKTAYLADGYRGLKVIDINDPAHPKQLGEIKAYISINEIELSKDGKSIFAADGSVGSIIDISNPTKPVKTGTMDILGADEILLSKDKRTAFVAKGYGGMNIIDLYSK